MHRGYHNASQPRLEKSNYKAAHTLQRLLGSLQPAGAICNKTLGEYAVRYVSSSSGGGGSDADSGSGDSSWAVWRTATTPNAIGAKCDHRQWMCCRYANGTIIPHCASKEGCEKVLQHL